VVFHDAGLLRAFPNTGPNIAAFQKLQLEGHERDTALVKVVFINDILQPTSVPANTAGTACSGAARLVLVERCFEGCQSAISVGTPIYITNQQH